jgi:SAM-dependent methyltransferase
MHGAAPSTRDAARRLPHRSPGFDEIPAVPYLALRAMMHAIPPDIRRSALVDFGCGVGRVLVAARRAGFGRAIGVESAESLVAAARANMSGYSGWEVVHSDSVNYLVPDDATVFVFGQPILGVRLAKVLLHIQRSVARRPRQHLILGYFNVARMGATAIRADVPLRRVIDGYYEPAGTSWAGWMIDA